MPQKFRGKGERDMAVYELQNENISIKIDSHGAELKSLKRCTDNQEYMWKGDPAFWGRTSPVLFPFVGGVHQKQYRVEGRVYPMNQHGFARDMEFELLSRSESEIWFQLSSSEETLQKYPYAFVLKLGYKLKKNSVEVCWQVENPSGEKMYFAIGGHPAFNCPLKEGTKQTDYVLRFDEQNRVVSTQLSKEGMATDTKVTYELQDGILPITEHLFDDDALVIENHQAQVVSLCLEDGTPYLTVRMEAPLFGIWSPPKKNAPFVCLEPWYGRCDREGYTGELKDREWENELEGGGIWTASYFIEI